MLHNKGTMEVSWLLGSLEVLLLVRFSLGIDISVRLSSCSIEFGLYPVLYCMM